VISAIKIRNFKGIKSSQMLELDNFHVLVGPNGSGKSTFLESIEFIRDCLVRGPLAAVEGRVPEFRDLTFMRRGGPIEFDVHLRFHQPLGDKFRELHYRLVLMADEKLGVCVAEELLKGILPKAPGASRPGGVAPTGEDE
jgi:hypothetical protein